MKKGDIAELEKMVQLFMNPEEYTPDQWLLFAFHNYALKKYDKASYFAHKSCYIMPKNVEACLLKGKLFIYSSKRCLLFSTFFCYFENVFFIFLYF